MKLPDSGHSNFCESGYLLTHANRQSIILITKVSKTQMSSQPKAGSVSGLRTILDKRVKKEKSFLIIEGSPGCIAV